MNLLMTLLRSAYLAFIVGYTLVVSPLSLLWSGAATREGTTVTVSIVGRVFTAAWLAIGWIALEVVLSWLRVWREARARQRTAAAVPSGPPPVP
jgi:hypothetical protein